MGFLKIWHQIRMGRGRNEYGWCKEVGFFSYLANVSITRLFYRKKRFYDLIDEEYDFFFN